MGYEEITVIDKYVEVGPQGGTLYGFYMIPKNPSDFYSIISSKSKDELPRIYRARLYYRVEYVKPTPLTVGSFGIKLLRCDGSETIPYQGQPTWANPVVESEVDVTEDLARCNAQPFGLNAVKVDLGPAGTPVPIPVTGYNVKVVMKVSWGW